MQRHVRWHAAYAAAQDEASTNPCLVPCDAAEIVAGEYDASECEELSLNCGVCAGVRGPWLLCRHTDVALETLPRVVVTKSLVPPEAWPPVEMEELGASCQRSGLLPNERDRAWIALVRS